jgi:hypothetical protein
LKSTETKYEYNWQEKSLENLEKDYWGQPDYESHLVKTCHQLRKKPLKEFEIEDLRIMVGQNIGLTFLIPLALEKLRENILAEGDYYEGDLLNSVLTNKEIFWKERPDFFDKLEIMVNGNSELLKLNMPELTTEFERLKSSIK